MKGIFTLIFVLFALCSVKAQEITWMGGISSSYFTADNWDPSTNTASLTQSEILMIGRGNPNDCVLSGGNVRLNYRPARVNVLTGATFTINGTFYPWGADSLNGTTIIGQNGDFSIRGTAYIGRNGLSVVNINGGQLSSSGIVYLASGTAGSSAEIHLNGGSFTAGSTLNIANGTNLTARLDVNSAAVNVTGAMNIGSGGSIYISGIGVLRMNGDRQIQLNSLISSGQLTCAAGHTLSVTYDGTYTYAQIPQNPNSMITEYPDSVVLKSGDLAACFDKNTGNILSYRYRGVETVSNKSSSTKKYAYHDFTTSYGFETMYGCTYAVVEDSTDFAHIVFRRPYTPSLGHITPCDAEIHYALRKGDKGIYVYSKLEHKPNYKAFDLGSWRQVWWMATTDDGNNLCEHIYADSLRNWPEYSPGDASETTSIAEILKLTSGVRSGKYDGKYEYSMKFWDNPVWGHASDKNHLGIWMVNASCEYYNEGPMYHDLNAAAGILHQCMNGVHYGAGGLTADTLTSWTKVFGPYLMLITDKNTAGENWAAAKERQVEEKSLWPYSWVKDSAAYPPAALRGSISGRFAVSDALKPAVSGGNAWIGVTSLADGATDFQFECKDYQYWVRTDANGNFTIPDVRPGTYSLFAFKDGEVGQYRQDDVTVTAGADHNVGTLTFKIDRTAGHLAWEIGVPDRMADEFKLGDFDYCEGFVQNKFRDSFPNPIEYNVSDNNWSQKLCYAQTKYPDINGAPGDAWKWRLNFTLPANLPETGTARLTIAYASNDHAQQWVYVNNENTVFSAFYPDNGGGNAFVRQSNYGKYSYKQISIPMSRLKAGSNTITLVMPSNSGWVSHLMYDYMSLEIPDAVATPVHLQVFTAKAIAGDRAYLSWRTSSEINSDYFSIERSADGTSFTSVGQVKAAQAFSGSLYSFIDTAPFLGLDYYRLKMVDKSGAVAYSAVEEVRFNSGDSILVYPNPVKNTVTVRAMSKRRLQSIFITNTVGQCVFFKSAIDASAYLINMSHLAKGVYFIRVSDDTDTGTVTKMILKQ